MNLSRVYRISRRLPDTLAICSVQITIFTSHRAARIRKRGRTSRILFFFPLRAKYSYARLTLYARYSHSLFKLPSGDKTGRTGAIANDTSSSRNTSVRFARCISCDTRRKYCRQSINPNVSRD